LVAGDDAVLAFGKDDHGALGIKTRNLSPDSGGHCDLVRHEPSPGGTTRTLG
jgi:hypothetical protein